MCHLYFLSRLAFFFRCLQNICQKAKFCWRLFCPFPASACIWSILWRLCVLLLLKCVSRMGPATKKCIILQLKSTQHRWQGNTNIELMCSWPSSAFHWTPLPALVCCCHREEAWMYWSGLEAVLCYVKFMRLQSFDLCECAVWLWIALLDWKFSPLLFSIF